MCAEHPGDLHRDGVWRRLHNHLDQLLRPEYQVEASLGSEIRFLFCFSRSITVTQEQTSKTPQHQTLKWLNPF